MLNYIRREREKCSFTFVSLHDREPFVSAVDRCNESVSRIFNIARSFRESSFWNSFHFCIPCIWGGKTRETKREDFCSYRSLRPFSIRA